MKYLFTYEPEKTILAFTTLGGHTSGKLMKNINFVSPDTIRKMKGMDKVIGDILYVEGYAFVVLRKHYNNKVSPALLQNALSLLPKDKIFKTTQEDFSTLWSGIEVPKNIEFYDSSKWGDQGWM